MSLMTKIRALISDISDTGMRLDVANSITYLYDLYVHGKVNEDSVRDDLYEIMRNVIEAVNPLIESDEADSRAKILVEEFIRTFRAEGVAKRLMSKYRFPSTF
jgi:hypothetical protein